VLFPETFLDEIRARVSLAEVIGRRARLVKKGREFTGLCPFHNEKSPSFTVNEDKGFFHCFGCGVHGDVITFVRQSQNMSFVEAVEALAGEAGLEVPKATPQERERAIRQKTLNEVTEAACVFFQAQLMSQAGAEARGYLERRGLDRAAIERFRLGYAPQVLGGNGLLKQQLLKDFPEPMLLEAGLVVQREDGRPSFDYFRDRVMFPILDRSGKVIAFGGRVMGDAKPKYLNSPDTPIFHKGSVLYGLSWARQGVGKGAEAVVTEGYMDVIALHRAGFEGAVAPLGTALTEDQLGELWRLAAEPILCFDGDAAGQRAAARALERALPLVKPGKSLRFSMMPTGEDPDTLIGQYGSAAMQKVLSDAVPLSQFLWELELRVRPIDSPERRAELLARLADRVEKMQDQRLAREYSQTFRDNLFKLGRAEKQGLRRGAPGARRPRLFGESRVTAPLRSMDGMDPRARAERLRQEVLFSAVLMHPDLLEEIVEDFAEIDLKAMDLDKLRCEIINVHATNPGLDAEALKHHLCNHGFGRDVETLLSPQLLVHARFALSPDRDLLLSGWRQALGYWRDQLMGKTEVEAATDQFVQDPEGNVRRVLALGPQAEQRRSDEADLDGPAERRGPGNRS
jgi:DNA primase